MLRSGEINFLADYGGDPGGAGGARQGQSRRSRSRDETDIGIEFLAFNNRRAPFNDPAFRRALSAAIDRNMLVQAAWNGFAVPSTRHVSPALPFWHAATSKMPPTGVDGGARTAAEGGLSRSSAASCTIPPA